MSLIVITGPTASGKTDLGIAVAKALDTEIISADSRQIYKGLEIGSAQPSEKQLREVKHHFIASLDIHQPFSAGDFASQSNALLKELFLKKKTAVMVGGSGLYIKALLEGMNEFPDIDEEVRTKLNTMLETEGIEALQHLLKEKDPEYFEKVDIHNPQRVIRALEVCLSTQKTFTSFQKEKPFKPDFDYKIFAVDWPRDVLYSRIEERTDAMMQDGFLQEAEALFPFAGLNPLNTVGYKELFAHFRGEISLDEAVLKIKQHTRNFAKRQLTWVRHQFDPTWLLPSDIETMTKTILDGHR